MGRIEARSSAGERKPDMAGLKVAILTAALSSVILLQCFTSVVAEAPSERERLWVQTENPSSQSDSALAVAVDQSGIYVCGADMSLGDSAWRIEKRHLTDGSLVWVQTSDPSPGNDSPLGAAVDASGIYIVGPEFSTGDAGWRIEKRSLEDGSLLWAQTSNPSQGYDSAYEVAADTSGVYVVGWDRSEGDDQWRIEKRNLNDGSLIWVQTVNPGPLDDNALDVAVDASGVYIVGAEYHEVVSPGYREVSPHLRVEKRATTDGSLIWVETVAESSAAWAVSVDSTGIYVVGANVFLEEGEWRMEKRSLMDGSLIWVQESNPSSGYNVAYEVAVDASGIYAVGRDEAPGDKQWRIEKRSLKDGSLIWAQTNNPSSGEDWAWDAAVDTSGVYVVGFDTSLGDRQWRIEKRNLEDGSLIVDVYLEVLTSYSTASESRWVEKGTQVTISIGETIVDHGNGTRRIFEGWYSGGSLFSEEPNSSFQVNEPMTLVAEWSTEQIRETPPPQAAAAAIVVGAGVSAGLTATMSVTGLAQQFNAAVSNLEVPEQIKGFLRFYAEETFKHLTPEELESRKRKKLISRAKLLSLTFSALVLLIIFSYVEVNGLPRFLDLASLMSVLPYVLMTAVLFFVAKEFMASLVAATLDIWCEFRIWLLGLLALVISGFSFLLPFGSPGRTDYEGDLDKKKAGLVATLKILCDLLFMLPFYVFLVLGFEVAGDAGLLIATMSAYYSSFPFKPLEGEAIYKYSKPLWVVIFAGTSLFFISTALDLVPSVAYLLSGFIVAILLVAVWVIAKRHVTVPVIPPPQPLPPPPPFP